MPKKQSATATKAKARRVVEPEDVEEEELEELDDDEVQVAPARKQSADVAFGAADLAKLLSERLDRKVTPRELRMQLRRMARDGRINREVIPGNKTRYSWSGPSDPEVKAIIKAVTDGELDAAKQEQLAALKERKVKQEAAKDKATKKRSGGGKKRRKPVVEEEDIDLEELEDDDE